MDCQRVPTETNATAVAVEQIGALLEDASLPYGETLSVEVADSHYSRAYYLHTIGGIANHVVIARSAGNRVYYRQPADPADSSCGRGHPTWYGQPFRLAETPGHWAHRRSASNGRTGPRKGVACASRYNAGATC